MSTRFQFKASEHAQRKEIMVERSKLKSSTKVLSPLPGERPGPIFRISKNGIVLYANKASKPLLHYLGCKTGGKVPCSWRKKVAEIFKDHEQRIEFIECGDCIYDFSIDPILNAGHVNFYGRDVAVGFLKEPQKGPAIDSRRGAEPGLKFYFDNSPLAIFEWNGDLIVTKWYSGAERIFGWKKEEIIGKRIDKLNIILDNDYPIVNKSMARLAQGKQAAVVSSLRNRTKSGEIIKCTWYNSGTLDQNGLLISVLSLVQKAARFKQTQI